jgi:lanthanide-dependent methanol dehydrogenase
MGTWQRYILLLAMSILPIDKAFANEELLKLEKDPNQWVLPTGNYANFGTASFIR